MTELWADHPVRQGGNALYLLDTGKETRKQTSKGQAKLGKVKPGYAEQRADVGAGSGVLGVLAPKVHLG